MTVERLSELQDIALSGKAPEGKLTPEEQEAWDKIRKRMSAYEKHMKSILSGIRTGKDN